jgi:protein-disulfide isomerase
MQSWCKRYATYFIVIVLASFFSVWYSCSAGQSFRFVSVRELADRLDLSELTPMETKRLEKVINTEVSPCGDNVTLAEALFNTEHCPLAVLSTEFIIDKLKDDYNETEVSQAYLARYAAVKGLEIPVDGSPRIGGKEAVVTLVVFTDFRCPYCARTAEEIHELTRRYAKELEVIYKAFPLAIHPEAELAARAAYAAHRQNKFWEMHDTIFSAFGSEVDRERLDIMAIGIGMDTEEYLEDIASPAATAAINADKKLGKQLGVSGTPTLFINGRLIEGGVDELKERLKEELMRAGK